jgi:hypothetical protein
MISCEIIGGGGRLREEVGYTWTDCCVIRSHALIWRWTPESRLHLTLPVPIAASYLNFALDTLPAIPSIICQSFDLISSLLFGWPLWINCLPSTFSLRLMWIYLEFLPINSIPNFLVRLDQLDFGPSYVP